MKKFIKPASFLLYLLAILVFFIFGCFFAGYMESGKDHGLAGGAIVLAYGVSFAFGSFILSLLFVHLADHKWVIKINGMLTIILLVLGTWFGIKFMG